MKLEPVYLVAPPHEPRQFSRRALIGAIAGGVFAGVGFGWLAARRVYADDASEPEDRLTDQQRRWIRWAIELSDRNDPAEYVANWQALLQIADDHALHEPRLWRVVDDIAGLVVEERSPLSSAHRRLAAKRLIQLIDRNSPPAHTQLPERRKALHDIARR